MQSTDGAVWYCWAEAPSARKMLTSNVQDDPGMNSRIAQTEADRNLASPAVDLARQRIKSDPGFAGNLLGEAIERLLQNEVVVAQLLLRDITNCTAGFPALARKTGIPEKSLMRMLSVKGNPQASNLFMIIDALQRLNGLRLQVRAV